MSYQHFAAGHIHSYNTHTHTLNGPFSGTIRVVSRYQKGKINLDFTEVRDSEWQWHQLGRMPFLQPNQRRQSTGGDQRTEEENTVITVSKYNTRNYMQTENNRNKNKHRIQRRTQRPTKPGELLHITVLQDIQH